MMCGFHRNWHTHTQTHTHTHTFLYYTDMSEAEFKTLAKVVEGNYTCECWVKCIVLQLRNGETGTAFAGMQRLWEPWPVHCVQQRVTLLYSNYWPRRIWFTSAFCPFFPPSFWNYDFWGTVFYFLHQMVGWSKNSFFLVTLGEVCFERGVFDLSDWHILLLKRQYRSCEVQPTFDTFFCSVSFFQNFSHQLFLGHSTGLSTVDCLVGQSVWFLVIRTKLILRMNKIKWRCSIHVVVNQSNLCIIFVSRLT
jgi:hypothetical protein